MVHSNKRYKTDLAAVKGMNADFTVERSGSFIYLNWNEKRYQYGPENHGGVKGAHLSKMVRDDVDQLVTIKQDDPFYTHLDAPSVYVNQANLDATIGQYVCQIDMKNCYWKTALSEGIITKSTYLKGLRKKEWKVGRNASIGSLDKKKVITYYRNGEEVDSERVLMPRHCRYARQKVLQTVNAMAMGVIHDVCKEGEFMMFVTDCFFVKPTAVQRVRDYLNEHGYDYTEATAYLRLHLPQRKTVVWDKIEITDNGPERKKTIAHEKDKFIHYTTRSIV